jgi:hypothetical protein
MTNTKRDERMRVKPIKNLKQHEEVTESINDFKQFAKEKIMNYKVQEHKTETKEFLIYQVASNGENCKIMAKCRDEKDANMISSMLNNQLSAKNTHYSDGESSIPE